MAEGLNYGELRQPYSAQTAEKNGRRKRGIVFRILVFLVGLTLVLLASGLIGAFIYWQYLKNTPQYSLALLVEAARKSDQKTIDSVVDTDAVIDNFVPQIVDKAVELYGRGLAPSVIKRVAVVAAPVMPVVKQRARAELPGLLREKTKRFEKVPFWLMVIGAERSLEIKYEGDRAIVKSRIPDKPLNLTMKRNGDRWQIIGFKDEKLARRIAEKIGQEIIALAKNRGKGRIDNLGRRIGVPNLGDIIKKAEEIFR